MNRKRLWKFALVAVVLIGSVAVVAPIQVHTRTRHTCLLCRVERTEQIFMGFEWESYRKTEFTDWHDAHLPEHSHRWTRSSCTRGRDIFGLTVSWACGPTHPIGRLPPPIQRTFAERA